MTTPRQHIRELIAGRPVEACGFWLGKPHPDTMKLLNQRLGTSSLEEVQLQLRDDVRWITPQYVASTYRHPEGKSMRPWRDVNPHGLSGMGLLSDAESLADLERVDFPDPQYLDFTETLALLDAAGPYYRLSGFWAPFFHDLCYLFGTEELLAFLIEQPELVKAASDRICTFYYEANERFYAAAGDCVDAFFFGNDFGTQQGLFMSPALFREHFLPWIGKFADQAHRFGHACALHCCGAIAEIIDDLIGAGVDCLHPMQTAACGMDPESLAARFRGRVTFMGGVDTQDLLQNGTPADVDREVARLLRCFGTRIIIGPSHEALLPSVNIDNVLQIARSVKHAP
jgi:uroporphyrinogen decarboxylase